MTKTTGSLRRSGQMSGSCASLLIGCTGTSAKRLRRQLTRFPPHFRDRRGGTRGNGRRTREPAMSQIEVGEAYEATTSALEAAKGQRLSLRRAIGGLEKTLTMTPATAEGDETGAWLDSLGGALAHLDEVFAIHVQVTEGAGGLYEEIVENAPRLANRVKRFRREHADMVRHRKRGLDLVYEAYHVDIGGES